MWLTTIGNKFWLIPRVYQLSETHVEINHDFVIKD